MNFAHERYLNTMDDARIEHNGTKGMFKSRGRGKPVFVPSPSKSAPDYYGCIGGQFIAFDAKTTRNKKTWRLKTNSVHQYDKLLAWSAAGAHCWFAVEHVETRTLYMVKVHASRTVEDRRPKINFPTPNDLSVLPCVARDGWYDWLPIIRFTWLQDINSLQLK